MTLRILHYSDVENAYDDPDRIGRLAGLLETERDENTLVVGSGDNTGPGVLSLVEDGAQALDFFDAIRPDAETFGNHDFDHGPDRTRELVEASPQTWVSANVREARTSEASEGLDAERRSRGADESGTRFAAEQGVEPWTLAETVEDRVAFVGVTTPHTPEMTPEAAGLEFTHPVDEVQEHLPEMTEQADYVVVLAHLTDAEPLAELDGVDAVLSGHTHEQEVEYVDGTPIVRPGVNGAHVSELTLGEDARATHLTVADAPIEQSVADALSARVSSSGLDEIVATVENPVERTEEASFVGESRFGNFVADAYRWAARADVGICSAGGARTGGPLVGDVTAIDLVAIAPFDQALVVGELDGERLRETFEQLRLRELHADAPAHYVGHVSGATLRWQDGDLVDARVGGEALSADRTYTLATDSYLFETDHLLPAVGPADEIRSHGRHYEAFVEYARETGVAPEIEGRIRLE
ncbi:bifunctional metallophosphatase/5'-nucleotidase [Halorussus halophilus]|uniref:bifunctional metallophosphatase/5'-nucleotidase n=1 Tax=Halorussus halophilus TaxID=2650975 RepID=UPI0013017158|nr:bifunctional metallophosphatase/5'-nucleotidase [Halorussus halophilus]